MGTDTKRDGIATDEFVRDPGHSLDCITRQAHGYVKRLGYTDAADAHEFIDEQDAIIRAALLTQAEARILASGAPGWSAALWDKLRRIAGDS